MFGTGFLLQEKSSRREVVVGKFPEKVEFLRLTDGPVGLFCLSRWKRDSSNQGVRSAYIGDCKLELNFVPACDFRTGNHFVGARLSFFAV